MQAYQGALAYIPQRRAAPALNYRFEPIGDINRFSAAHQALKRPRDCLQGEWGGEGGRGSG